MSKNRKSQRPALAVTVTITMAEHDGETAGVNASLAVDGEEWMVQAIQLAWMDGSLRPAFDAMTRAVLRPIGEIDRAARAQALAMHSSRVARA